MYLQACRGASPIRSGVGALPNAFVMGAVLIMTGMTGTASKAYRVQLWVGWAAFLLAMGLLPTVHAVNPATHFIGLTAFLCFAASSHRCLCRRVRMRLLPPAV